MAYTLQMKQRLEGINISATSSTHAYNLHNSSQSVNQYGITEVLAHSVAAKYGVSVGDTLLSVNQTPFPYLVAKCGFKNPNTVLKNVDLPFTVTLVRNYDEMAQMIHDILDEIPDCNEFKDEIQEIDSRDHVDCTPPSSMCIFSPRYSDSFSFSQRSSISLTQSLTSTATLVSVSKDICNSNPISSALTVFSDSNKTHSESNRYSLSPQLLKQHIIQKNDSLNQSLVHFDTASKTQSNGKVIMVSSKALENPITEWTIEIMKCDVPIQEIGICGTSDVEGIEINDRGVTGTVALGARGVYGNSLEDDSLWYGSFNKDGQTRCFKNLTQYHRIGWTAKTQIKVVVNLEKWRIRFWINGKKVRKVLSLESRRKYYPFISFAGNCRYKIL